MDGDSYVDGEHEALEPDGVEDIGAEEERGPQQREGDDLGVQRNDLALGEVADIGSQVGMAHEPVVHATRTAVVAPGGKQQQRRSGQHWQEDADDAHC